MLRTLLALGFGLIVSSTISVVSPNTARAALSETWFQLHEPSWTDIHSWKSYPGPRTLRLQLESSPTHELAAKLKEAGFDRVQITSPAYPTVATMDVWNELAAIGAEYAYIGGLFPTERQVQTLNEIRFKKFLLVLIRYPEYHERSPLLSIDPTLKYDLHFSFNRYPTYLQKFPLAELPHDVGIQVSVDYWPRYVHMDVLNLIPQGKKLRIHDSVLTAGSIPYTMNLENMDEIIYESDFEPPFTQWTTLEKFNLRWILKDLMPSPQTLENLKTWAAKPGVRFRLVLDPLKRPSAEERRTYDALPFDVEWTADAP